MPVERCTTFEHRQGFWTVEGSQGRNLTTIQEMSSLLFLATASSVRCLAAAWGSFMSLIESTASWFDIT